MFFPLFRACTSNQRLSLQSEQGVPATMLYEKMNIVLALALLLLCSTVFCDDLLTYQHCLDDNNCFVQQRDYISSEANAFPQSTGRGNADALIKKGLSQGTGRGAERLILSLRRLFKRNSDPVSFTKRNSHPRG